MAKRPSKGTQPVAPAAEWINATTLWQERSNLTTPAGRSDLLVQRATGWAEICANVNAVNCSAQRLRLYRNARGARKGKRYRPVGKSRMDWLRGAGKSLPGPLAVKAAMMADDAVEVLDHPILDFLDNPNPSMTGSDWRYMRFKHQEIAGNAYTWLFRDGEGVEAYILEPQYVTVKSSNSQLVERYRYSRNRTTWVDYDPSEVMHQKNRPSNNSPILGAPPLEAVIRQLDLFDAAMVAEAARWRNGGRPELWAKMDDPRATPDQIAKVRDSLNARYRGATQAGGIAVTSGLTLQPIGLSSKEMEYVKGLEFVGEIVWAAYDIPQSEMKLNDANLASAVMGSPQYMRRAVLPRINSDADALTRSIIPLFGLDPTEWWFSYDNPCIDDAASQATQATSLVTAGLVTVNEARTIYLGLPTVAEEGADALRMPQAPPVFGFGPASGSGGEAEDRASEKEDDGADQEDDPVTKSVRKPVQIKASGWHFHECAHTKEAAPTEYPPAVDDAYSAFQSELEKWYKVAASRLASGESAATLKAELSSLIERHLVAMLSAGIIRGASDGGKELDPTVAAERASNALRGYVVRLTDYITSRYQDEITQAIRATIGTGLDLADAQREVASIIGEQASYRAERVARTELSRAYNEGSVRGYGEAGYGKEILLAGDACPACQEIKARYPGPVAADTVLFGVGDVAADMMNDYQDCMAPPFHPNCRCGIGPVRIEDEQG